MPAQKVKVLNQLVIETLSGIMKYVFVTGYGLRVTGYGLRVTGYGLRVCQVAGFASRVTSLLI